MIWKRSVLLVVLAITGLALETSVLGANTLLGSKPELLLLMVVALAMAEGAAFGTVAGFVMGLGVDLVLGLPQGLTALTYTVAGYVVGRIRATFQTPVAWLPMAMVTVTTFVATMFYGLFSLVLGEAGLPPGRIVRHALLASVYNGLLTPFLFPVVRGLAARMRPPAAGVIR